MSAIFPSHDTPQMPGRRDRAALRRVFCRARQSRGQPRKLPQRLMHAQFRIATKSLLRPLPPAQPESRRSGSHRPNGFRRNRTTARSGNDAGSRSAVYLAGMPRGQPDRGHASRFHRRPRSTAPECPPDRRPSIPSEARPRSVPPAPRATGGEPCAGIPGRIHAENQPSPTRSRRGNGSRGKRTNRFSGSCNPSCAAAARPSGMTPSPQALSIGGAQPSASTTRNPLRRAAIAAARPTGPPPIMKTSGFTIGASVVSYQMEVNVDVAIDRNGLAVLHGRLEPPCSNRLNCLLIEAQSRAHG